MNHDCSTNAVFLCTADKTAIFSHVGTLKPAYLLHLSISIHSSNSFSCYIKFFQLKITLGRILAVACPTKEKLMPTMACFCGIPFLTDIPKLASVKTRMLTHRPNLYRPQFSCASLGWSFCHGNGIDPNILSSGHHESWLFQCFSAQLSNCNLLTCWHIELSILALLHLSIRIHLRISFSCSMKFFQLKITLGLALGESWPLLAQPQKNIDVSWIMTVPQRLHFSAHMLAHWTQHIGPSPVSISLHLRISFSCSMKFFQLKITLGLALGESWPLLAQPQKSIDVYKGLLPWEGLPRQTSINHLRWNKDVSSWIKFRLYNNSCAPALGGACAIGTNTMAMIQTS